MQYKINTSIVVSYLSVDNVTGLTDLELTPTNPSGVDKSPIIFTEVGDGLYRASFTPDAIGWWEVRVSSLTYPENVFAKSYYVGTTDSPNPIQDEGKIRLWDGSNYIQSLQDGASNYNLGVALIQNALTSAGNSSTANILAGETFTGSYDAAYGINAIQVIFKADKLCTLYIDQSIDHINWDIVDSFVIQESTSFAQTITSVAPYFRVRITNNAATDTTYVRLAVGMTPVLSVLPRTLSSTGSLQVDSSDRILAERNQFYFINIEYTSGSAETDAILLTNPSSSTKNFYLKNLIISGMNTTAVRTRVRVYQNPTITNNGTSLTIRNRNIGSSLPTSAGLAYYTPTISNRNIQEFELSVQESNTVEHNFELGQIIYPNNSILITIQNDGTNKLVGVTFIWAEL